MSELEKAGLAIEIISSLLKGNRKILAVKITRLMYKASLSEAKPLVDKIQRLMEQAIKNAS